MKKVTEADYDEFLAGDFTLDEFFQFREQYRLSNPDIYPNYKPDLELIDKAESNG